MNLGFLNGLSTGNLGVGKAASGGGGGGDPVGDALRADAVAYWKLDEASGERTDSTGNGHTATPVNAVSQGVGKIGDAVDFDASVSYTVDEQYMTVNTDADMGGGDNQDWAIAGWFKIESFDYDTFSLLTKEGDASGTEYSVYATTTKIEAYVTFDRTKDATYSASIDVGVWYFVVAWQDSAGRKLCLQVNGGAVNEDTWTAETPPNIVPSTSTTAMIGAQYSPNPYNFANGLIDELGFWHRVLTADERAYLYNSGNGRTLYP